MAWIQNLTFVRQKECQIHDEEKIMFSIIKPNLIIDETKDIIHTVQQKKNLSILGKKVVKTNLGTRR